MGRPAGGGRGRVRGWSRAQPSLSRGWAHGRGSCRRRRGWSCHACAQARGSPGRGWDDHGAQGQRHVHAACASAGEERVKGVSARQRGVRARTAPPRGQKGRAAARPSRPSSFPASKIGRKRRREQKKYIERKEERGRACEGDVADAAAVGPALGHLQLVDDLHRAHLRQGGGRGKRRNGAVKGGQAGARCGSFSKAAARGAARRRLREARGCSRRGAPSKKRRNQRAPPPRGGPRTFGAPDTVPAGSAARRASQAERPSRSSPVTVEEMCMTWE